MESLQEATQFVLSHARAEKLPGKRMSDIELCLEEALVNIFQYAYPEGGGEVEISCRIDEGRKFIIEISDAGIPFDIFSVAEPDLSLALEDRKIGGLGILLIRKLMDDVTYRREGNRNALTLTVIITPS